LHWLINIASLYLHEVYHEKFFPNALARAKIDFTKNSLFIFKKKKEKKKK